VSDAPVDPVVVGHGVSEHGRGLPVVETRVTAAESGTAAYASSATAWTLPVPVA